MITPNANRTPGVGGGAADETQWHQAENKSPPDADQLRDTLKAFISTLPPECQEDLRESTVWSPSSMRVAQDLLAWARGLAVTAGRSCAIISINGKLLCGFFLNGDTQRSIIFTMKVWK